MDSCCQAFDWSITENILAVGHLIGERLGEMLTVSTMFFSFNVRGPQFQHRPLHGSSLTIPISGLFCPQIRTDAPIPTPLVMEDQGEYT
jgi:hypothetical protein